MSISNVCIAISLCAAALTSNVTAFSTQAPNAATSLSIKSKSPMFEYLKFDKNPKFDVLEKTQEYLASLEIAGSFDENLYAEDYVLRGPVIGPINRADLAKSQSGLGIRTAFPDIKIDTFGLTVDPENPYRCFYFQRWRGTNSGDLDNYGTVYPATGNEMETPVSCFSVVWNPEGKIVYEQVGAVVDRLEGNTQGKAAVFGMLHAAGLELNASPGDKLFALIQRLGHLAGNLGRSWSREEEIPKWFISKSRGADETDVYF
uniref:Uncharacterized protein n=1 Tax=Helicotheca tamesis TaxID=374047 RepID=A0A7S2HKJ8_9STRA|mmetsp:Transcript_18940/g.26080  ORF Transcript_18940/g.26080 Transcript_18940/m.26080 type:complete len:260 (+) Transcript_18940:123-902(+)|eukprot:CAMPEP_0185732658 /NCGR_PEP_ID=MMETSP1171-20130828/17048_1 /TAXON_ID=374046 /ORGANISM="Helicotheca tamensis, Strain CCMP826" /LENGTH=259 /DNA_ID=CAMNT_0028402209 /DNA_START=44 /DNA_END=823 /DNA_ORIENTATION=+